MMLRFGVLVNSDGKLINGWDIAKWVFGELGRKQNNLIIWNGGLSEMVA